MSYDALLLIDIQTALTEAHPYRETAFLDSVRILLQQCRKSAIPVIYVQHDGGRGDELEFGSAGWEICSALAPQARDPVVTKRFNSSFRETNLQELLTACSAQRLILCGMQTEHCIDATVKVAFELGYTLTIGAGTTTTFDNGSLTGEMLVHFYEDRIWNNRYARVIPLEHLLEEMKCQT